jgi:pimeloyl-ACP methyl ester carboxylesterase
MSLDPSPNGADGPSNEEEPRSESSNTSVPSAEAGQVPKRKRRKWPWLVPTVLIVILVLAWVGVNCFAASWIAHNGYTGQAEPSASSLGFPATNVSYGQNLVAWYAPPQSGKPVAVIVHGYQANRSHEIAVAAALHQRGYGVMVVDLGYVSGKVAFGGGDREANEVIEAVQYVHRRTTDPVVLLGNSEGGAESILAAERGAKVDAVISDSAPVSFLSVAAQRAGISQNFFALTYLVYGWFSGGAHLENLANVLPGSYKVPTLVIQGTADATVPYADGPTLARLTHGQLWKVKGAGHDEAFADNSTLYIDRVVSFVTTAIASHT